MKTCKRCKEKKELTDFYRNRSNNKMYDECIPCCIEVTSDYRSKRAARPFVPDVVINHKAIFIDKLLRKSNE